MTGVVELLAHYPPPVIEAILSPVHGLPGKHKFLPLIAEIREACEAEMGPYRRQQERDRLANMSGHLLEAPRVPRTERPTIDELRAKHGPNWGINQGESFRKISGAMIDKANNLGFQRACEASGADPDSSASPQLRSIIAEQLSRED